MVRFSVSFHKSNPYTFNNPVKVENDRLLNDEYYSKFVQRILKPLEKKHSKKITGTIIGSKEEYLEKFKKKVEWEKGKDYWSRKSDVFEKIFDKEYIVFLNKNRDYIDVGGKIYVIENSKNSNDH